jgi:hypothetical protein
MIDSYKNKVFCNVSNRTCYNQSCDKFFSYKDLLDARKEGFTREPNIAFGNLSNGCNNIIENIKYTYSVKPLSN